MWMDAPGRAKSWVAWSSGKDSLWALHVARQSGELEVVGLLSTVTATYARVSMHGVREELLEAQARALGLPVHRVRIPAQCSNEEYEAAMARAVAEARAAGVQKMIFGDLFLADVRAYRESRLKGTGIAPEFPLWGRHTAELAREMIAGGVRAYLTCLDPRKLPREMAGRAFDLDFLNDLPPDTDPCGENGEFHTFAWDGPGFSSPLEVSVGETVEREAFVFTDVVPA
jgi:uncharacterized protein (TIGR00290 family)